MYDLIVAGGGISGGLPAAAYLQKAGCSVAVIERDKRGAPFSSHYERAPGVRFDVTPVNFSIVSPAIADLDLAAYGYRIKRPEVLFSTQDGTGRRVTLYADPEQTQRELARYSTNDATAFARLMGSLNRSARDVLSTAFFTASPDKSRAMKLTASAAGILPAELEQMTAPMLVERLFESDAVRIALTALPAINLFGDLVAPEQGALAWLWTFLMRSCSVAADTPTLSQAVERVFLHHGGTMRTGATITRLIRGTDGTCRSVEIEADGRHEVLYSRHGIISDLGADLTAELLGEPLRPAWRTAGRTVFTADVVLNRPLAWESEGFRQSPRVYLLWDDWDACVHWLHAAQHSQESIFLGHIELTQFWLNYGCGMDGAAGLRVRFGTGPYLDTNWRARRSRYERAVRECIHTLDPKVAIRSLDLTTPDDYWRWNPAARHGNPVGGDFVAGQWMGERLPYKTAIAGLYMANSVWPTSLSWMAPGYNVAGVVAEDLGIQRPPWWSHGPLPDLDATSKNTAMKEAAG